MAAEELVLPTHGHCIFMGMCIVYVITEWISVYSWRKETGNKSMHADNPMLSATEGWLDALMESKCQQRWKTNL